MGWVRLIIHRLMKESRGPVCEYVSAQPDKTLQPTMKIIDCNACRLSIANGETGEMWLRRMQLYDGAEDWVKLGSKDMVRGILDNDFEQGQRTNTQMPYQNSDSHASESSTSIHVQPFVQKKKIKD